MAPPRRKHTGKSLKRYKKKDRMQLRNVQIVSLGGKHLYSLSHLTDLDGRVENGHCVDLIQLRITSLLKFHQAQLQIFW